MDELGNEDAAPMLGETKPGPPRTGPPSSRTLMRRMTSSEPPPSTAADAPKSSSTRSILRRLSTSSDTPAPLVSAASTQSSGFFSGLLSRVMSPSALTETVAAEFSSPHPRLGTSNQHTLDASHHDGTQVDAAFFGLFGQSEDPFGLQSNTTPKQRLKNIKTDVDTYDGPDKTCGYLEKKVQHPQSRVVLKSQRYFVWNKKKGSLQYYKDHNPGSPGTEALSVELLNKAEIKEDVQLILETYYATASHGLKLQRLLLFASTPEEAQLWLESIETVRLHWLLSTEPRIIFVQKQARRFLAIRRAARQAAAKEEQRARFRSTVTFVLVGFALAMALLSPVVLYYRNADSLGDGSGAERTPLYDAFVAKVGSLQADLTSLVAVSSDSSVVHHHHHHHHHNSAQTDVSGLMGMLGPLLSSQAANVANATTAVATTVTDMFAGNLFGMNARRKSLSDLARPELVAHINAQAHITCRALRKQLVTLQAQHAHTGKAAKSEERVHSFSLTLSQDTRTHSMSQLRVRSKMHTSDVHAGVLQCMVMAHTDDGVNCKESDDGRCLKIELFLEVLEQAIQSEFTAENVQAQHFSIPQATFFSIELSA